MLLLLFCESRERTIYSQQRRQPPGCCLGREKEQTKKLTRSISTGWFDWCFFFLYFASIFPVSTDNSFLLAIRSQFVPHLRRQIERERETDSRLELSKREKKFKFCDFFFARNQADIWTRDRSSDGLVTFPSARYMICNGKCVATTKTERELDISDFSLATQIDNHKSYKRSKTLSNVCTQLTEANEVNWSLRLVW